MVKIVCDICKKRPADNHFKVKKEIETAEFDMGFVFPKWEWLRIDICKDCYRKLLTSIKEEERSDICVN